MQQAQDVIARLCTILNDRPVAKVFKRTKRRVKRQKDYPLFSLAEAMNRFEAKSAMESARV